LTDTIEPQVDDARGDDAGDDRSTARRVAWFVGIVVVLLLVRTFVVEPVRVHGNSMEPTLPAGAVLVIDKVTFHARDPQRGDVIVTSDPRTGELIVKRIVATEGDSVGIENGVDRQRSACRGELCRQPRHGRVLLRTRQSSRPATCSSSATTADSIDSRAFGPVAVDSIEGRVLTKVWPVG
jgi:signal peptidase I